jgi:hypothetical protein
MDAAAAHAIASRLAADMLKRLKPTRLAVLLTLTSDTTGQRELIRALRTAAQRVNAN